MVFVFTVYSIRLASRMFRILITSSMLGVRNNSLLLNKWIIRLTTFYKSVILRVLLGAANQNSHDCRRQSYHILSLRMAVLSNY